MYYASPLWWAWPLTLWQCGQHFPVLASNSSHCHPVDSAFDTNILLSHVICPSLCRYGLVTKKIVSAYIDYIIVLCSSAMPLDWLLSRNLKPRKLILRAFSDFPRKLPAIRYSDSPQSNFSIIHNLGCGIGDGNSKSVKFGGGMEIYLLAA